MLQPLQSEYVDRRFDGTKVGCLLALLQLPSNCRTHQQVCRVLRCFLLPRLTLSVPPQEEYFQQLELSSTLYIGNLSFYTTEDQVMTLGAVAVDERKVLAWTTCVVFTTKQSTPTRTPRMYPLLRQQQQQPCTTPSPTTKRQQPTYHQVYELFGKVGSVRRVIMGLDRHTKTPCGFCFVIYHTRGDALRAVQYLNGTKLDNRQLRVDIDYGFEEGRQYGRGRSGGQVRVVFCWG